MNEESLSVGESHPDMIGLPGFPVCEFSSGDRKWVYVMVKMAVSVAVFCRQCLQICRDLRHTG